MQQSGEKLEIGEIRLRVGNEIEGLIHAKAHEKQAQDAGYDSVEDLIADVAQNFNQIYMRTPDNKNGKPTYSLVKTGDKKAGIMNGIAPVYFELQSTGDGNCYIVISAIPKGDKNLARQTKTDRLIYSSPGLDAATESNLVRSPRRQEMLEPILAGIALHPINQAVSLLLLYHQM